MVQYQYCFIKLFYIVCTSTAWYSTYILWALWRGCLLILWNSPMRTSCKFSTGANTFFNFQYSIFFWFGQDFNFFLILLLSPWCILCYYFYYFYYQHDISVLVFFFCINTTLEMTIKRKKLKSWPNIQLNLSGGGY